MKMNENTSNSISWIWTIFCCLCFVLGIPYLSLYLNIENNNILNIMMIVIGCILLILSGLGGMTIISHFTKRDYNTEHL